MARGMVVGEQVVSQASTDEYREGHERTFGERTSVQTGRWIYRPGHPKANERGFVAAADLGNFVEPRALDAPIIADRIHEGTTFHDGERVRDLGSRQKRRAFLRETGLVETADCSKSWLESQATQRERSVERRIDASAEAAARKLYHEGKMRD